MAEIKTYPLFRHLRAEDEHVLGYRGGALRREGPGPLDAVAARAARGAGDAARAAVRDRRAGQA